MKVFVVINGRRHAVWLDISNRTIEFAGPEQHPMSVAPSDSYAYTHGGALYRAACDRFWEEA